MAQTLYAHMDKIKIKTKKKGGLFNKWCEMDIHTLKIETRSLFLTLYQNQLKMGQTPSNKA
jgi:hypothetical protein